MGHNTSPLADKAVREIADRALANGRGLRIRCDTLGEANGLRTKIYKMRLRDRKDNLATYDEGHPLHGNSVYDILVCTPTRDPETEQIYLSVEVSSIEQYEERIEEL